MQYFWIFSYYFITKTCLEFHFMVLKLDQATQKRIIPSDNLIYKVSLYAKYCLISFGNRLWLS